MAFDELVVRFKNDLETVGATVIDEDEARTKPSHIRVITNDRSHECLLFLWNITPGGKNRKDYEWRIQVTGSPRFSLELGTRTIIGGWHEGFGVWAFWDVMSHTRFSSNSPSFQIRQDALERAQHFGVATQVRTRMKPPETVLAVKPEYLLWYVQAGDTIHNSRIEAASVVDLVEASPEVERNFVDESGSLDQAERRYALVESMRAFRDAKFKPAVLRAYRYKCAVCGVALKLVDAAHIVPVMHPKSQDVVTNGLGLCRLHHAAYDNALIGIRPDYSIILNPNSLSKLERLSLLQGLEAFREALPERITHPSSIEIRPNPEFLRLGLEVRRWPQQLIG